MKEETKDLIAINAEEFQIEADLAGTLSEPFREPLQKLIPLEKRYEEFRNLTGRPPKATCEAARELRLDYRNVRLEVAEIHKNQKAFFLNAGRFVDAWKRKEKEISDERENALLGIENYEKIENEKKIAKLQEERAAKLEELESEYIPEDLGEMTIQVWEGFYAGMKAAYDKKKEEEKAAEEKAAEDSRREAVLIELGYGSRFTFFQYGDIEIESESVYAASHEEFEAILEEAKKSIEAYDAEQERIRAENEKLNKEKEAAARKKANAMKKRESAAIVFLNEKGFKLSSDADRYELAEPSLYYFIKSFSEFESDPELELFKVQVESQIKVEIEKAEQEKREAEEAAAAAAPDKEKLIQYIEEIICSAADHSPNVESKHGIFILTEIIEGLESLKRMVIEESEKL